MTQALLSPTVPTGESSALVGTYLWSYRVKCCTLKPYLQHTKRESSSMQNFTVTRLLISWNLNFVINWSCKILCNKVKCMQESGICPSRPLWQHTSQIMSASFKWMVLQMVGTVKSSTKATSILYMLESSQVYMHNFVTKRTRKKIAAMWDYRPLWKRHLFMHTAKYKVNGFM